MSEDKVVNILKQQHRTLDESVHSLAKETASIKGLTLRNQETLDSLSDDMTVVKARVTVLEHKVDEGFARVDERFARVDERFARVDERFDQLELLIRQLLPNANN